ncbi:hypothetical protein [Cytobacillus gottheilii]|uniref:hypothetical protein n=1 Tax=Cytobacillus gottheilii TaxID=859144 RepID=UPI0009BBA2C5|nr:hypothetical protein [Cytobacillus gottheilii]
MNRKMNEQLNNFKAITPSEKRKQAVRTRLATSLQTSNVQRKTQKWKGFAVAFLTVFVCSISIYALLNGGWYDQTAEKSNVSFSWKVDSIISETAGTQNTLYRKSDHAQVGVLKRVNAHELEDILNKIPIFMEKELPYFPYPTKMYIEHVKKNEIVQRYHFVIEAGSQTVYASFDYPKAEYAEIFHAISTISIEDEEPYVHDEPIYVTFGYDHFYYPATLEPVEITHEREVYNWRGAAVEDYYSYLTYLQAHAIGWELIKDGGPEVRYRDRYENTILISFEQGKLIYENITAGP